MKRFIKVVSFVWKERICRMTFLTLWIAIVFIFNGTINLILDLRNHHEPITGYIFLVGGSIMNGISHILSKLDNNAQAKPYTPPITTTNN